MTEPRNFPQDTQHRFQPTIPATTGHLSAFSPQSRSNTGSPAINSTYTPAASISSLSVNYQSSEYSDSHVGGPFFDLSFGFGDDTNPDFINDQITQLANNVQPVDYDSQQTTIENTPEASHGVAYLPLSPEKTPLLDSVSFNGKESGRATFPNLSRAPATTHRDLAHLTEQLSVSVDTKQPTYHLTPDSSGSGHSSDDGLAPAAAVMAGQSPRVTVSMWGKDEDSTSYPLEEHSHQTFTGISTDDSAVHYTDRRLEAARDDTGYPGPILQSNRRGLDPHNRPTGEVQSVNELTTQREIQERNQEVDNWLASSETFSQGSPDEPLYRPNDGTDNIPDREISTGDQTENRPMPGQTYYIETGGEVTQQDLEIIRENRNWADAPVLFPISRADSSRYQPESSNAAIKKFEDMCRDNDSIVSRAATWGTRRRSLPIIDIEGITSGNFLKKLSISRGEGGRRPSFLNIRQLVRRPSASFKRSRAEKEDDPSGSNESLPNRKESQASVGLAPPTRSLSWNKNKQTVPSINTAFVAMGGSMSAIGAGHARSGSLSATSITSPKSASNFSLSVKKPNLRMRSKSDITSRNQGPGLVDMLKMSGGPPVASLAKTTPNAPEAEDEDDDEDDSFEDSDAKADANKIIDDIQPNLAGFQQHVLKLNPQLATSNNYLVDRIAYQQIVRYKTLLNAKVKHLQCTANNTCSSGAMCIAQGGSSIPLDSKGDPRGLDPLSAHYVDDEDITSPLEGAITQESFPADIPMPPTGTLPAEFECQLCFQPKKFQKPSDWTKHVHEDVQPFTCTWDRCRDPKIFKRKADWVRHENEGHRHLEWWTCDVEDCHHICYRRDNFLQHLVREHKFPEPKVKTKAAIKRAGAVDPTWAKVEKCHQDTRASPMDEPCRFCGKRFPSWKKLTVHLAKHMEQISLPILRLVARKELEVDTIISPVQDPPPRQFPPIPPPIKPEPQSYEISPSNLSHMGRMYQNPSHSHQVPYTLGQMYPIMPPGFQTSVYGDMQSMTPSPLSIPVTNHQTNYGVQGGFSSLNTQAAASYSPLPATTAGTFITPTTPNANPYLSTGSPDLEPFPDLNMNALGLQDPTGAAAGGLGGMGGYSIGGGAVGMSQLDPQQQQQQQQRQHQYTPQGSVSPYAHSPHNMQGGFYGQ